MAKDVDLSSKEWRDIIFEGKNKEFGAYQLRKASDSRHNRAMIVIVIVIAILFALAFLVNTVIKSAEARPEDTIEQAMAEMVTEEAEPEPEEEEPQRIEEQKPEVIKEDLLNTAKMTADSKKALFDKNIISEYEYQLSQNSLAQAQSQLANAKAALASAQKNLAYTVVTSPSDGVVGTIPSREGSLASPSSAQPLTTVSDNSQVYAYFSLTENDLLNLVGEGERSMEAAIKALPEVRFKMSDGKIYPLEGKVATVSGVIDNNTGASSVRALFNNPQGILRSGATGQIIMPDNKESVLVIPQKATFELQDRRFVYVVNDSNKVVSTPIVVEANNDGKNFVVTSGLQPGQRIAIEGVGTKLSDGMAINPVAPKTEGTPAQAGEAPAEAAQAPAAK